MYDASRRIRRRGRCGARGWWPRACSPPTTSSAVEREARGALPGDARALRSSAPARRASTARRRGRARARRRSAVATAVPAERLAALQRVAARRIPADFTPHPRLAKMLERRARGARRQGRHRVGAGRGARVRVARHRGRERAPHRAGRRARHVRPPQRGAARPDDRRRRTRRSPTCPTRTAPSRSTTAPLSETAVLGFEYGFTVAAPDALDAVGGAVRRLRERRAARSSTSSSSPTARSGGTTRGSSCCCRTATRAAARSTRAARLERFLQLCAEGNMTVAYPSTPAQYFHLLRRQAQRQPRRPLVLMQPKSLLRLPAAASPARRPRERRVPAGDRRSGRRSAATTVRRVVLLHRRRCTTTSPRSRCRTRSRSCAWRSCIRGRPRRSRDVLARYPERRARWCGRRRSRRTWARGRTSRRGCARRPAPHVDARATSGRPERASPAEGYEDGAQGGAGAHRGGGVGDHGRCRRRPRREGRIRRTDRRNGEPGTRTAERLPGGNLARQPFAAPFPAGSPLVSAVSVPA